MAPKMDPKSMKNRGCVADAFLERFGAASGAAPPPGIYFWEPVGSHFRSKFEKMHPKKHPKINAEKVMKIDAKRIENEAKIDTKICDF